MFSFFINVGLVRAVTTCEYSFENPDDIIITYDEGGTPNVTQNIYDSFETSWLLYVDKTGVIKDSTTTQMSELTGACPATLYVCGYEETAFESGIIGAVTGEHSILGYSAIKKVFVYESKRKFKDENGEIYDLPNRVEVEGSDFIEGIAIDGGIGHNDVNKSNRAVRPAMWINVE